MKKWYLRSLACLLVLASALPLNSQTMEQKYQCLVALSAFEAKGDLSGLRRAVGEGLDAGLTVNQIKEALSQLYAYTGFPRSLNALGVLQTVARERGITDEGPDASPLPSDYDALRDGTRVQTKLSGKPVHIDFAPQTDYYLKAHLFGDIFARDVLTPAEREMATVSAISALPGCEPQLQAHIRGARNMGVSEADLQQIPDVLAARVGAAEGARCRNAINAVDGKSIDDTAVLESVWPKGEFNAAYAQYFIGNSYLAPMDGANGGPTNVSFEPRCRNNWHIHHGAVQVLICVSGRGWYQEWGKEPVEMREGSVIAIPAEVKHWHGAARDSWFQHLAYMTRVEEGASKEWLEPVGDDVYDRLP